MNLRSTSFFLLLILLLVGGCAHQQDFNMPVHRLETPETAGKSWAGSFEAGTSESQKVVLNELYPHLFDSSIDVNQDKAMRKNGSYVLNLRVGMLRQFEFLVRDRSDSPTTYGVKWQVFGSSRLERRKGWKLGVAALGGASNQVETDNRVVINNQFYKDSLSVSTGEFNFLSGFRFSNWFMLYGTSHASWYDVDAKLVRSNSPTLKTTGSSWQYGQTLGAEFAPGDAIFKIETGLSRGSYRNQVSRTDLTFGASTGFSW